MKVIRDVLRKEIDIGAVNWNKLENKIHAAIGLVDNTFDKINNDGKMSKMKFKDSLTFAVNCDGVRKCYKLIKPRFIGGINSALICSGLQIGYYDLKGQPYFPNAGVFF